MGTILHKVTLIGLKPHGFSCCLGVNLAFSGNLLTLIGNFSRHLMVRVTVCVTNTNKCPKWTLICVIGHYRKTDLTGKRPKL